MKRMITIILIFCLAAGVLSAIRHTPFSNLVSPTGNLDRDRSWKIADRIIEDWNGAAWDQSEKLVYYYNATRPARVDSVYTLSWDTQSSTWVPEFKLVYTYQPDGEYVSMQEYTMMIGGYNIPYIHIYATYDNQNRLTHYRVSMYSMETSSWSDMVRQHIAYGTGTTFQVTQWQAGNYVDPAAYGTGTFAYDTPGRVILETWQTSADSVNWVNDYQTTRTYHPHDTTSGAQFIYNIAHQMMLNIMEDNGLSFGMVSEELEKTWVGGAWVNDRKSTYTYNANDKMLDNLTQNWNGTAWVDNDKYDYTYDTNGNAQQIIYQTNSNGTTWVNNQRTTYTWSQFTANDDNVLPPAGILVLNVYPNPFREAMTITGNSKTNAEITYNIYNLKGQSVRTMTAANHISIMWDGLDNNGNMQGAGIYFVKATQGNINNTQKFLKLK